MRAPELTTPVISPKATIFPYEIASLPVGKTDDNQKPKIKSDAPNQKHIIQCTFPWSKGISPNLHSGDEDGMPAPAESEESYSKIGYFPRRDLCGMMVLQDHRAPDHI